MCQVSPVKILKKILKHEVQFSCPISLKRQLFRGRFLCLLLIDSEKMKCHISFLSCLSNWLICLYIIFIWCSLKTDFWEKKSILLTTSAILFLKPIHKFFDFQKKKMPLSWQDWLFRFCWACGLELPVHALDRHTGVWYLFFFNQCLTFLVAAIGSWKRELCVCIVLWMGCHHLTFFMWRRLERKGNGRKVGAIFSSL